MKDKKYDIFNIATGEFEEMDVDPNEFFDKMAFSVGGAGSMFQPTINAPKFIELLANPLSPIFNSVPTD